MAKLTLLLATFALFLLAANASMYRTTVLIDDENQGQSCDQQIQRVQQLNHCQMFLSEMTRQQGPRGSGPGNQQEHFAPCCQQLQFLDTRCRCQGLEQAFRSQIQQGQMGDQQMRQLYETARFIPLMCRMQPMQGCQFSSPFST